MHIPTTLLNTLPPRSIDLNPEDWLWATWRERKPLPRPEPKPFNQEEAIARLRKTVKSSGWRRDWLKAKISVSLLREEAHFWFVAMTNLTYKQWYNTPFADINELLKKLADTLSEQSFNGQITLNEIKMGLARAHWFVAPEVMLPLQNLLPPEKLIDLIVGEDQIPLDIMIEASEPPYNSQNAEADRNELLDTLTSGFITYVWPYLTETELTLLRTRLQPHLDMNTWPSYPEKDMPPPFWVAAVLGIHKVIYEGVKTWPDGSCHYWWNYYYPQPHQVIFGLGSAELLKTEVRRLELPLVTGTHVRAWLAHTEYAALDLVRDSITTAQRKEDAEAMLKAFGLVHAPEAVPYMLALLISSKVPQLARQWLEAHPAYTIVGAIALVAESDELADIALSFLTRLRQKGYGDLIETYLEHFPAEAAERIRAKVLTDQVVDYPPFDDDTTPAWLRDALPVRKKRFPKPPATWVDLVLLPPIVIEPYRLNETQVTVLLQLLKKAKLDQPLPAPLVPLKTQADSVSMDAFAWGLFELWLQEGIPGKDKWALNGVGLLGSEALAFKLAQLVRVKVNVPEYKRIPLVESCLKVICHDTALMQFQSIAQKTKFKGLQAQARTAMEAIARERGLSRAQLEDRLVPDCGLDERGGRLFDFGPRQFRFAFGPDMKPMVRDDQGKLRANLPKPGVKDNTDLANRAIEAWKQLKKDLKQVTKLQTARLEEAMVNGRRWPVADFETVLVRHPLLFNLVRLLLWGGYDATDHLVTTFRLTEDRTYADVEDETATLDGIEAVGVVHPLLLADDLKAVWGEIFSDYELIPPFSQLWRETYRLAAEELTVKEITRFAHLKVPAISMVSILERAGWVRGTSGDGGLFDEHSRPFPAAEVTAVVRLYRGCGG